MNKEIREYLAYHIEETARLELAVAFAEMLCNDYGEHYVSACNKVAQIVNEKG